MIAGIVRCTTLTVRFINFIGAKGKALMIHNRFIPKEWKQRFERAAADSPSRSLQAFYGPYRRNKNKWYWGRVLRGFVVFFTLYLLLGIWLWARSLSLG
jgi:hypothetical protein